MRSFIKMALMRLIQFFLKLAFNFDVNRLLYSNKSHAIYKFTRDIRNLSDCSAESGCPSLGKTGYFGFEIYFQKNDLRGYFNNYLDEESSRIFVLYLLQKVLMAYGRPAFLDVGSNYGTYTIPSVELNVPSVLVEPNPFVSTALNRTFGKFKSVKVISKAISSDLIADDMACISIMPFLSGSSSIKDDITQNVKTSSECFSLDVSLISIDMLIDEIPDDIESIILKLDVEGIELDLFRGGLLKKLRKRFDRFIIFVEFVPSVYSVKADLLEYTEYLCNLPSIVLSNKNYKFSHQYGEPFHSFSSILDRVVSVSNIFDIKIYNPLEANKELAAVEYADVVLFSDLEVANNFFSNYSS